MWGNTLETSYTNDAIVTSLVNGKNKFKEELKDTHSIEAIQMYLL